jgi:hypothetical protein
MKKKNFVAAVILAFGALNFVNMMSLNTHESLGCFLCVILLGGLSLWTLLGGVEKQDE